MMTITAKGNILYGGRYYKSGEPIEIAAADIPLFKGNPQLNGLITENKSELSPVETEKIAGLPPLEEPSNGRKRK